MTTIAQIEKSWLEEFAMITLVCPRTSDRVAVTSSKSQKAISLVSKHLVL